MPPRLFSWVIVAFWLGMTGWLVYRDVVPRFRTGRPPTLAVTITDEVRPHVTLWFIYKDRQPIGTRSMLLSKDNEVGRGWTTLKPRKNHSFEHRADFDFNGLPVPLAKGLLIVHMAGSLRYNVTPGGADLEPRGLAWETTLVRVDARGQRSPPMTFAVTGDIAGGRLTSALKVAGLGRGLDQTLALDPVPVTADDRFLNPLQPLGTMPPGLHEGQRWRERLVDPLARALLSSLSRLLPRQFRAIVDLTVPLLEKQLYQELEAVVSADTLSWCGRDQDCLVIDYFRPGTNAPVARTWVNRRDRRVLRQEAEYPGSRLVLVRGADVK